MLIDQVLHIVLVFVSRMADPDDPCAVYVGGISFHTDEEKLRKEFSTVGEVMKVKVILY